MWANGNSGGGTVGTGRHAREEGGDWKGREMLGSLMSEPSLLLAHTRNQN